MIRTSSPSRYLHDVRVHDLAAAWNVHAVSHGLVEPGTQLMAVPAVPGNPEAGYRPAFYVPSSRTLVVVFAAQPHRTYQAAKYCLIDLLDAMHRTGAVNLTTEIAA